MFDEIETRLKMLYSSGAHPHLVIALAEKQYGPGLWASPEDKAQCDAGEPIWSASWNISSDKRHMRGQRVYASSLARLLDAIVGPVPGVHVS